MFRRDPTSDSTQRETPPGLLARAVAQIERHYQARIWSADLAHLFNITVPAVKSRLHRTRLRLRELLDEKLRGQPPR